MATEDGSRGGDEDAPGTEEAEAGEHENTSFTWEEWTRVAIPFLVFLALFFTAVIAWYLLQEPEPDEHLLRDVDEDGSFSLVGHWMEEASAYGPHVRAINLTLEEGDDLSLVYTSTGPPGGIQVRLQRPLHPTDGVNGSGGTEVYASTAGGNGSLHLLVREEGAYQVYFWHPGSLQEPGEGDDPTDHTTAAVSYRLVINRANRP